MSDQVESLRVYFAAFIALMVLLGVTVGAAFVSLGTAGNLLLALTVASVKALIIVVYFMHLRHSNVVVRIFAASGFVWLTILIIHLMSDYLARNWLPSPGGWLQ